MARTAIVIGATGLIGEEVIKLLVNQKEWDSIKIFARKPTEVSSERILFIQADFNDLKVCAAQISGDVVFCCLGTTIKTAGSKEAFAKVDYTYVMNFADIAKRNGVPRFVLVSSLGVSEKGGNFYLTVKRDVENALKRLKFQSLVIVRPSMLLGKRKEFRLGEWIGKGLMKGLSFLFIGKLKKYKAIEAAVVAKAMVALSKTELEGVSVFESDRLQDLGKA